MTDDGAPRLVLGPMLRYVSETEATIWVETDRACRAEILGHAARTFEVSGHHYALVVIGGLRPGAEYEYQVALDGAVRWPEPDSEFLPDRRAARPATPLELPARARARPGRRGRTRPGRDGRLRPGPAQDAARALPRP